MPSSEDYGLRYFRAFVGAVYSELSGYWNCDSEAQTSIIYRTPCKRTNFKLELNHVAGEAEKDPSATKMYESS